MEERSIRIEGRAHVYWGRIAAEEVLTRELWHASSEYTVERVMEFVDAAFSQRVRKGDILVVGEAFGWGDGSESVPLALKAVGVGAVVGLSLSRTFVRHALSVGLPALVSSEVQGVQAGDWLEVDVEGAVVRNLTRGVVYRALPLPEHVGQVVICGGLIPYLRWKLDREGRDGLHLRLRGEA